MQKKAHRIKSIQLARFLRFTEGRNTRKPDLFEKTQFGPFRGEKFGGTK